MKTGSGVYLHTFTSALVGGEWSNGQAALPPGKERPSYPFDRIPNIYAISVSFERSQLRYAVEKA
jgi:hypothetical protein